MTRWAAIQYREYWDLPRIFVVKDRNATFLFDCAFDETSEDYPDFYEVYLLPDMAEGDYAGSWADLYQKAIAKLGTVPRHSVKFDPTRRQCIDASILDGLVLHNVQTA